jgi:hypothetical protein
MLSSLSSADFLTMRKMMARTSGGRREIGEAPDCPTAWRDDEVGRESTLGRKDGLNLSNIKREFSDMSSPKSLSFVGSGCFGFGRAVGTRGGNDEEEGPGTNEKDGEGVPGLMPAISRVSLKRATARSYSAFCRSSSSFEGGLFRRTTSDRADDKSSTMELAVDLCTKTASEASEYVAGEAGGEPNVVLVGEASRG